jgi:uncharacterized protein
MGEARFVQAAGFLKIRDGENPLDQTWIHPESYAAAQQLLGDLGFGPASLGEAPKLQELREKVKTVPLEETSARLQLGPPTLKDIIEALEKPGRDPREDLPPPIFKHGVLKLEDLQPGMELKGTVLNVVDFGAFIDIGLKDSGLVHISQMANRYIKNPYEVVAVGAVVTVWVLTVDQNRRRVSLTMIKPGTERKPPERKPGEGRPPRGERPPRQGERPPPQGEQPAGERPPGERPPRGDRPPRGRPPYRPPPRHDRPAPTPAAPSAEGQPPAPASAEGVPAPAARSGSRPPAARAPLPPPRPHKPKRQPPKPKLSQAALEGAAPLRSLGELAAFFEAKRRPPPAAPAATPETTPAETPAAAAQAETIKSVEAEVKAPPAPEGVPAGEPGSP